MKPSSAEQNPFRRLLVPLDGSRLAEDCLPVAAACAERFHAAVTLIHVIERDAPTAVHGDPHLTGSGEARGYLETIGRSAFPATVTVDRHVHADEQADVAVSLVGHAEELRADLIVMCTHGRGGLRHRLFGTVAQRVVGLGRIPVLLIPAGVTPRRPFACHRVLAPLDGDPAHEGAEALAAAVAGPWGGTVQLLVVVRTLGTLAGEDAASGHLLPGTTATLLDLEEQRALEYVARRRADLEAAGVSAEGEVRRGDPADVIVDAARRLDVDLVALASHGKSGMDAFWAGSVAPRVATRVAIPLLLVPVR